MGSDKNNNARRKAADAVLRSVFEEDFAKRPITDEEWDEMPIREHVITAMVKYGDLVQDITENITKT